MYQRMRPAGAATGNGTSAPSGLEVGLGVRVATTQRMQGQGELRRPATRSTSRSRATASSR
jgi:flagellar basal body rod protein FlgG